MSYYTPSRSSRVSVGSELDIYSLPTQGYATQTFPGSPGYSSVPSFSWSTPPPGVSDPSLSYQKPEYMIKDEYKWKDNAPIMVYIVLAVIGFVLVLFTPGSATSKVYHMLLALVWLVIWGIFIVWATKKGNTTVAWVLVAIPLGLWLIFQLLIFFNQIVLYEG